MRAGWHILVIAGCVAGDCPAAAQTVPGKDVADQAQVLPPDLSVRDIVDVEAQDQEPPPSGKPSLVVAPIPMSNPAIGTGIAGAAVLYYNPNQSKQPWVSGIGGAYTDTHSWAIGAFHNMSAMKDRLRVLAFAGYGELNVNFYGIGPDAGSAGVAVDMHDAAFAGLLDGEFQIFRKGFLRHLYFGGRFLYLDLNARVDLPKINLPNRPDLIPPPAERNSTIAMLGPSFTFDSRDNSTYPRKGVYVTGSQLYGVKWLGSDFTHKKFQLAANGYFTLGKDTVVGVRRQLCATSSDAPYYDLCMFGAQGDLRGYEPGRYRDGASWAIQAEFRQHVAGRFGIVTFGGVGGIADNAKSIWKHSSVLASGGVGLRYLVSKSANVNLRADVAWGKDGSAFYFGIGEAF